jgi:hypothetical protein
MQKPHESGQYPGTWGFAISFYVLSDRSVVIIDLHVGKNEGDVGIITVHVGKIGIHVGITLKFTSHNTLCVFDS